MSKGAVVQVDPSMVDFFVLADSSPSPKAVQVPNNIFVWFRHFLIDSKGFLLFKEDLVLF